MSNTSTKKLRIAINGFGRIGRNALRAFLEYPQQFDGFEIVAINDTADSQTLLHLLKFDSTHGRLSALGIAAELHTDTAGDTFLCIHQNGQTRQICIFGETDPEQLPWRSLGVDVVLECTGQFRSYGGANLHRRAGAGQVVIGAAPFDTVDACIVIGVNDEVLSRELPIISSVSCTTQALVPLLAVLDDSFGITSVMMTEIHAVTADQTVLDQAHRDWRRARASGHNIIPTTSSSIAATERVLPQMAGRINGHSIRVPTINVAAIDVTLVLDTPSDENELKSLLKHKSHTTLQGIMGYTDEPLVSSDFVHDRHSLVIDGSQIMTAGQQLKIFAWYDNEWGYANRLLDLCQRLAKI